MIVMFRNLDLEAPEPSSLKSSELSRNDSVARYLISSFVKQACTLFSRMQLSTVASLQCDDILCWSDTTNSYRILHKPPRCTMPQVHKWDLSASNRSNYDRRNGPYVTDDAKNVCLTTTVGMRAAYSFKHPLFSDYVEFCGWVCQWRRESLWRPGSRIIFGAPYRLVIRQKPLVSQDL